MIIITVNDPWTDIGKAVFMTDHLIHWHCFLDNKSSTANIWFTEPIQGPVRGDGKDGKMGKDRRRVIKGTWEPSFACKLGT